MLETLKIEWEDSFRDRLKKTSQNQVRLFLKEDGLMEKMLEAVNSSQGSVLYSLVLFSFEL